MSASLIAALIATSLNQKSVAFGLLGLGAILLSVVSCSLAASERGHAASLGALLGIFNIFGYLVIYCLEDRSEPIQDDGKTTASKPPRRLQQSTAAVSEAELPDRDERASDDKPRDDDAIKWLRE